MASDFLGEHFLLSSEAARRLYFDYARAMPIFDYHCHLPPEQIADNHRFANLTEVWLGDDHYKWRVMRALGVDEALITGAADARAKFRAWAEVVPYTVRNPVYHWTHMELRRPFGIDELLTPANADAVYDRCNELLATDALRVRGLLEDFDVRAICTTDDPADDLAAHRRIAADPAIRRHRRSGVPARQGTGGRRSRQPTTPTWNGSGPPPALTSPATTTCCSALERRHGWFHEQGCRLSDHGLEADSRRPVHRFRAPRPRSPGYAPAAALASGRIGRAAIRVVVRAGGDGRLARLGAAVPSRRHARPQHPARLGGRPRLRVRQRRRPAPGAVTGAVPRPPRQRRTPGQDHPVQPQPERQRHDGGDDRQLPGRHRARQDAVRHRVVVQRPDRRHARADGLHCPTAA